MIFQILFFILSPLINALKSLLPCGDPACVTLPFGLDPLFVQISSYWHGAMITVPYFQVVWTCFLYVMAFELALLVLKLFLGSRAPHNTN